MIVGCVQISGIGTMVILYSECSLLVSDAGLELNHGRAPSHALKESFAGSLGVLRVLRVLTGPLHGYFSKLGSLKVHHEFRVAITDLVTTIGARGIEVECLPYIPERYCT